MQNKSCQTNLISFFYELINLVNKGICMEAIKIDFCQWDGLISCYNYLSSNHERWEGDYFWNPRMAWVAKDHSAHPVPTPCYVQGRQPTAQAAQSHIQPGLECLQGWGIHSLLGQPVQCVTTLWLTVPRCPGHSWDVCKGSYSLDWTERPQEHKKAFLERIEGRF